MNELSQGKSAGCRILYALTYIYIFLHAKIEQQNDAPLHSLFHYGGKKPHNFPLKIFFKLKKKKNLFMDIDSFFFPKEVEKDAKNY